MNTRKVIQSIHSYLIAQGFQKKNNHYFKRDVDVLYCLSFTAPSCLMYCQYFVMPLYMPFSSITYTYGKRMNTKLSSLEKNPSSDAVDDWCVHFRAEYERAVVPYFNWVKQRLTWGIQEDYSNVFQTWGCMAIEVARLSAYTATYQQRKIIAKTALVQYGKQVRSCTLFSAEIISRMEHEINELTALIATDPQEVSLYFDGVIQKNLAMLKI